MPSARLTFWQLRWIVALMAAVLVAVLLFVVANRSVHNLSVLAPDYLPSALTGAAPTRGWLTSESDRDLMVFGERQLANPFQRRELGVWIVRRDDEGSPRLWQIGGRRRGRHLRIRGSPGIYFDDRGDRQVSWSPNVRLRIDLQSGSLTEAELLRIARSSATSAGDISMGWLPPGLARVVRVNDYCNIGACRPVGYAMTYQRPRTTMGVTVGVQRGGAAELIALRWFAQFRESKPVFVNGALGLLAQPPNGAKEVAWLGEGQVIRWVSAYGIDSSELLKIAKSLRPWTKA